MKVFSYLYNKMLGWSQHKYAPYYLAGVSFAESSFFPIPPDVMLLTMGMASPKNAWRFAFIATCFSVLGGIFGYLIGHFAMEFIAPYIAVSSYQSTYTMVVQWFRDYGIWIIIVVAGFSPIPYKIFTIAAGALHMAFLPFVIASWIGRGMRFYSVSALMYFYGDRLQKNIEPYVDRLGVLTVLLVILLICIYKWVV